MNAHVMYGQAGPDGKHDTAVVAWDWKHSHEPPADAINEVLAHFYNQDLHPFCYLAWTEDGVPAGMLWAEAMDLEGAEIQAIYQQVIDINQQVHMEGEFSAHDVQV